MLAVCNMQAACQSASMGQEPRVEGLGCVWLPVDHSDHGLDPLHGVFAFQTVQQRYSPLAAATSHADQQPSECHGMRRMVQFLNPQDWLYAQVWGLVLAASAWASLQGAGVSSACFTFYSGVGGGFRWNLPLSEIF